MKRHYSYPFEIRFHCSVLVNSTTILIIGGEKNANRSSSTYFFNTENEIWTEGPPLKYSRMSHSCGRVRKNSQSQELSVIVVGGWGELASASARDTDALSSVEILDLNSNEWRAGPELPFGVYDSQLVEDQKGGVVLVAGYNFPFVILDTLYQLPHGGADVEWTKMEQRLKFERREHLAFLVPDSIVDCS